MKKISRIRHNIFEPTLILINITLILIFTSCVSSELRVSQFEFIYNNQNYIVRSAYCPGNPESSNQLIGDNFLAVDMNQDRVIDKITSGDISFAEAQEIYDYCLNLLERENKLGEVNRENKKYTLSELDYNYDIKTFYPKINSPFNEFTITDKRGGRDYHIVSILLDEKADGLLDELLKGGVLINEAQVDYDRVLLKGLKSKGLKKVNGSIFIK